MKKGINIVVLGVLTVASVILALPFTPLRNSFKGVTTSAADKALNKMGVDFNAKIHNARLIAQSHDYQSYNFVVDAGNGKKYLRQESYSGLKGLQSDGSINLSDKKEAPQQNSALSGDLALSSVNARNKVTQMGGFVSVSTKLNSENPSSSIGASTKQSGNAQNNGTGGGTHPGVDPTPLPSLPLGNGFLCLFSLALVYVGFKKWD